MTHKNKRRLSDEVKLEMTPMIDVVFQLLIFFIVVLKPVDILSQLDAMRPMPGGDRGPEPITITVTAEGFVFNRLAVSEQSLGEALARQAKYNRDNTTIAIKCTADSPHSLLVRALDICKRNGISSIAVFSI